MPRLRPVLRYAWWVIRRVARVPRYWYRRWRRPDFVRLCGVRFDARQVDDLTRHYLYSETYETGEARCVWCGLEPRDVVLEVGAGIGFISTLCALRTGSERVFCFEANPELLPAIRHTHGLNEVAPTLTNAMLAREDGESEFFVQADFLTSSSTDLSGEPEIRVPAVAVAREMQRIQPTFVVMDIEGGESELLPLMDLSGVRKIALELHPGILGQARVDELLEDLAEQGFRTNRVVSTSNKRLLERERA